LFGGPSLGWPGSSESSMLRWPAFRASGAAIPTHDRARNLHHRTRQFSPQGRQDPVCRRSPQRSFDIELPFSRVHAAAEPRVVYRGRGCRASPSSLPPTRGGTRCTSEPLYPIAFSLPRTYVMLHALSLPNAHVKMPRRAYASQPSARTFGSRWNITGFTLSYASSAGPIAVNAPGPKQKNLGNKINNFTFARLRKTRSFSDKGVRGWARRKKSLAAIPLSPEFSC